MKTLRIVFVLLGLLGLLLLSGCGPEEKPKVIPPPGTANTARVDLPEAWAGWPQLSSDGKYLVYAGGPDAAHAVLLSYDLSKNEPYRKVSPEGVEGVRWVRIANPIALTAYIAGEGNASSIHTDSYLGGSTRYVDGGSLADELYLGYDAKRICWVSQKPGEKFRTIRYAAITPSDILTWKPREFHIAHPCPSYNGGYVTWVLQNPAGPELHLADYGGGEDKVLDKGALEYTQGAFSPDEKTVVFVAKYPGTDAADLYIIPFAGGSKTQLTKFDVIGRVCHPWVTPDGNYVYFLFAAPSDAQKSGLWRVGLAGGKPEQIRSGAVNSDMPLSMTPDGKMASFAVGDGSKSEIWLVRIENAPPLKEYY